MFAAVLLRRDVWGLGRPRLRQELPGRVQSKTLRQERSQCRWQKITPCGVEDSSGILERLRRLERLEYLGRTRAWHGSRLATGDPSCALLLEERQPSPLATPSLSSSDDAAQFGMDFWRLPLPLIEGEGEPRVGHASTRCTTWEPWVRLVAALVQREGPLARTGRASRKVLPAGMRTPSASDVRRWQHLHGTSAGTSRREAAFQTLRPFALTTSYQSHCEAVYAEQRRSDRLQRRWRSLLTRCYRHECEAMLRAARAALQAADPDRKFVAHHARRQAAARPSPTPGLNWATSGIDWSTASPARVHDWSAAAHEAAALGLDEATYRLLKELEAREITPEDYDLLSRLDEATKPPTLSSEELCRFPMEIYQPATPEVQSQSSGDAWRFGVSFWKLPLPPAHEEERSNEVDMDGRAASFGMDFWRLPLLHVSETSGPDPAEADHSDCDCDASRSAGGCTCGVCLVDFEAGDELRTLVPCGHRFHRGCIDHWLLERSTACPVDKRDLRQDG